ncbi:MAG TPA: HPr family phosphocarrier protein [Bacillota bacterium]|jgi:phosphotransferase system HPr (HPr) family protein|nr:HPr family phosphocarrier protein [Fastidiosipila sp.]HPX93110.1 HPr family phosphocarrier protein [Bacillota bacterium]HQB81353.1 HPr family phosphocarrier protein [Bacillota bacterium]
MMREEIVFRCKEETLMKAVAMLIQISSGYTASIYIAKNGRRANAKSLLGVLSLGISDGDHLEISVDGSDGESAICELKDYMEPATP